MPETISLDTLWRMQAYRLALYAAHVGWQDAALISREPAAANLAEQLLRAVNSISANIAEGYSRRFKKEKCHFYDYAAGSAREARDWYYKARYLLDQRAVDARLELLTRIVKLLTVMVARARRSDDGRARR